jgi:hypothetical protein
MKFGAETDLVDLLRFPGSAIACDCGASEERPGMHPRFSVRSRVCWDITSEIRRR